MKILVLASNYPYPARPFVAAFNERIVEALKGMCDAIEVLVPRPYAPPLLSSLVPRWQTYASIPPYEVHNGVSVFRPAYPQIPRVGGAFCVDQAAFLWCRRTARSMHRRVGFDAILSLDVAGAGGFAWRTGRYLGIPASGWAFGDDVRLPVSSAYGQSVSRTIKHLDVVFYQSHELLEKAAGLLGVALDQLSEDQHVVLPHGIPLPPVLHRTELRDRVRKEWGITNDQVLVLSISRIIRGKGVFELVHAVSSAAARDARITCVLVGSSPAFDDTAELQMKLDEFPGMRQHVRLLPACNPDKVWEYLCAADIFAFTSQSEGMPNSLLEAMVMGVPAVAFAIPPVLELEAKTGALLLIPPFDLAQYADALVRLAASAADRSRLSAAGKDRVMDGFMVRKNMAIALERLTKVVQQSWQAY